MGNQKNKKNPRNRTKAQVKRRASQGNDLKNPSTAS